MEFIESNRVHLIQRMGMITVKQIADDLLACNVMSYEEVNTIACEKVEQEASRMMIYMILNKGSEACNILVKSLEKHNPFLFHDLQGYCKYYWLYFCLLVRNYISVEKYMKNLQWTNFYDSLIILYLAKL